MKICKVEGCENKVKQNGYCNTHYLRWYRHGDPLYVNLNNRHAYDKRAYDLTDIIGCWVVECTRGAWTMVDTVDIERVRKNSWNCNSVGYAESTVDGRKTLLHRFLMNPPDGLLVDHINKNKLDNRSCNLRVCNRSQNACNSSKRSTNKSGFKGVYWSTGAGKFQARICKNGKQFHLGFFTDPKEASRAYNKAALKYHGDFARDVSN